MRMLSRNANTGDIGRTLSTMLGVRMHLCTTVILLLILLLVVGVETPVHLFHSTSTGKVGSDSFFEDHKLV